MIRSLSSNLRHTVFGVLFAASFVFGSAQAFATPRQVGVPIPLVCHPWDSNSGVLCSEECVERGYASGYCAQDGACRCRR
jgi:hypothetical protein